ncbi:2-iminoacetate synthase ThiH [Paludibacter sp.]|uniref:2-iminoacetate synthase ThiH n=1 Tax=Paludibacter sp. TaxID=1898105 RepID=UPI0013527627|nr:2-iminoacetate synthase ThiH [Paludibacter sp.]MTK54051.1 2-iminoacetate synthase ThiH [Paludibacter sp.]
MTFFDIFQQHEWETTQASIYAKTAADVERTLAKQGKRDLEDFKALISPAAQPYLEQMAVLSRQLTQKRFGKTLQLYIPLYLSNECTNSCVYCGFRHENETTRITLNEAQTLREATVIQQMGFEHLLLVTGEHPRQNGPDYLKKMLKLLRPMFAQISLEVAPMKTEEYQSLVDEGAYAVYVYQETYNAGRYAGYHPRGKKANMQFRLETGDRCGEAGMRKIGLGCLLGLEDWRTDSFFTALHLNYLEKRWWQSRFSVSFPRIRPFEGSFEPNSIVTDADLLQLICAYRIFNEEVEIALSTRERPAFRDNLVQLGVTTMSAGSRTDPGGYTENNKELEQFAISDDRDPETFTTMVRSKGYEVVWKDWDMCLQTR